MEEKRKEIIIPYTPRELQNEIHNNLDRFNVVVCHRRFGKTVFAINLSKYLTQSNINSLHISIDGFHNNKEYR